MQPTIIRVITTPWQRRLVLTDSTYKWLSMPGPIYNGRRNNKWKGQMLNKIKNNFILVNISLFLYYYYRCPLDIQMVDIETVMSGLCDEFPLLRKHRFKTLLVIATIFLVLGLAQVTQVYLSSYAATANHTIHPHINCCTPNSVECHLVVFTLWCSLLKLNNLARNLELPNSYNITNPCNIFKFGYICLNMQ